MQATALITGGTGGLGRAVTAAFLEDGWRAVVPSRRSRRGAQMPAAGALEIVEADLFDPGAAAQAVAAAAADADYPLRAVVNLTGGYAGGAKVEATPIEDFEAQLRVNLRPTYLVVSTALPHLIEARQGTIVCVSSRAALHPFSGAAGYIAAKAAVIAFARAVAVEHIGDGVRTNTVVPNVIDTEANRAAQPDADRSRWVAPEKIAAVIGFLCSPASEPINGAAIPVYGPR
jgi:NAD(P)-dependent dehydrogenase (short-subunit alcohol dehydrogenase family)